MLRKKKYVFKTDVFPGFYKSTAPYLASLSSEQCPSIKGSLPWKSRLSRSHQRPWWNPQLAAFSGGQQRTGTCGQTLMDLSQFTWFDLCKYWDYTRISGNFTNILVRIRYMRHLENMVQYQYNWGSFFNKLKTMYRWASLYSTRQIESNK